MTRSILEGAPSPEVAARCMRNEAGVRSSLSRLLTEAKEDGELQEAVDVEVASRLLSTHIYGLSTAAAAGAPREELQAEVQLLLAGLTG